MKKKGFTLIELLAVIIILAIIALIATPIVMRLIENSKKGAAERSAENYIHAIETKAVAQMMEDTTLEDGIYEINSNGNLCSNHATSCDEVEEIKIEMNGTKPSSGKIQIENGKVMAYSLTIGGYENKYGTIHRIPLEYQEVEYIESTGTQYIDTEISGDKNPEFNITFSLTKTNALWHKIFGVFDSDNDSGVKLRTFGNKFYCWVFKGYISEYQGEAKLNVIYNFNLINNGGVYSFYVNNILIGSYTAENQWGNNIGVFGSPSTKPGDNGYSNIRLYNLTMKTDGILIRDFVPCYSTTRVKDVNGNECPEGTIGLYDLVSKKFYTNQGSGTFTAGPDVN